MWSIYGFYSGSYLVLTKINGKTPCEFVINCLFKKNILLLSPYYAVTLSSQIEVSCYRIIFDNFKAHLAPMFNWFPLLDFMYTLAVKQVRNLTCLFSTNISQIPVANPHLLSFHIGVISSVRDMILFFYHNCIVCPLWTKMTASGGGGEKRAKKWERNREWEKRQGEKREREGGRGGGARLSGYIDDLQAWS